MQHEGLNEATVGELRMATSTLQEDDVARERAAGQGARLLRGEEHKNFDADVRLQKEVKKNDVRAQKQETAKDTAARAVAESRVMLCQYCSQSFVRQQCFRAHEDRCVEQSAIRASKRKTAVLRPAADLAQDQVHSVATQSTPTATIPLLHTLDTSRPDKYKRWRKESQEAEGRSKINE